VCAPDFDVEPLGSKHDREAFTCSSEPLQRYLRNQAKQDARKHAAVVYVLTPNGRTIAGYYTLSQFSIKLHDIPFETARGLARYPDVPATLIGRLALDDNYRGKGLGEKLLLDALQRCLVQSRQIASCAVVVDAKDAQAKDFYQKYGFLALPGIPNRLFLPMATIEQM
jgi:predicted GNAT family N-acyltransferase